MFLRKWRARRATKLIRVEHDAALESVDDGTEEWRRWWRGSGQRELRCILMTAWDPIGVADAVEAWDEYDDYESGVVRRIRDTPDPDQASEQVAEYLNHIERDFMELSFMERMAERRRANAHLAEALVAWHEWSFKRGGRPPHEWIDED